MALTDKLTAIADAVRGKTGGTELLTLDQMAAEIAGISGGENEVVPFIENTITSFSNEDLAEISSYGFAGKSKLQSLYIPNVVAVGGYAFEDCLALTEIHFEKHITIGKDNRVFYSFRGAINAKKIEFSDGFSVENNSSYAFYKMGNLEALIIRGNNLSPLNTTNNFNGSTIEKGTGYIYVPAALLEDYKAATNWVTFADQFRAIEDYPEITGG